MMCLGLEDTVVAKGKKDEMISYLTEVFTGRCHIPLNIRVEYHKPKESKMKKFNELQLRQEVEVIMKHNASLVKSQEELKEEENKKKEKILLKKAEKMMRNQKYRTEMWIPGRKFQKKKKNSRKN